MTSTGFAWLVAIILVSEILHRFGDRLPVVIARLVAAALIETAKLIGRLFRKAVTR